MTTNGLEAVLLAQQSAMVRFLRARGAGEDAEDILQELWLRIRNVERPIDDPRAYIYRMADNMLLDWRRSQRRHDARNEAWLKVTTDVPGQLPQPSAERVLIAREELRFAERELAKLGDRTVSIFKRFRLDGVGQKQISAEQGISVSAVEKHLRKCYRRLTDLIAQPDAETAEPQRLDIEGANDVEH